ncbi:MAG: hypothetical protein ACO2PN_09895 [Pyrobaculum sp.]|jgi:hypothetical protein
MTVPKTALVAALLLLLLALTVDAARATLLSTGPYDYYPWSTVHVYLSWFPPHAVPMNLMLLNVTWWKPEAIWFIGKYYVRVCGGECRYEPATIYVVQDGVSMNLHKVRRPQLIAEYIGWHIKNRYCAQGIAMVDPIKIIVLNPTTQIWISDVYCLYYNQWYWLRLLPYDILLYGYLVRDVEFINNTSGLLALTPVQGIAIDEIPAGWYLHPVTKEVFRIPGANLTLLAELQRAERSMYELQSLLENKTALLASANLTIAQLNETVARLKAVIAQLNSTIAKLETALAEARGEAARLSA